MLCCCLLLLLLLSVSLLQFHWGSDISNQELTLITCLYRAMYECECFVHNNPTIDHKICLKPEEPGAQRNKAAIMTRTYKQWNGGPILISLFKAISRMPAFEFNMFDPRVCRKLIHSCCSPLEFREEMATLHSFFLPLCSQLCLLIRFQKMCLTVR